MLNSSCYRGVTCIVVYVYLIFVVAPDFQKMRAILYLLKTLRIYR